MQDTQSSKRQSVSKGGRKWVNEAFKPRIGKGKICIAINAEPKYQIYQDSVSNVGCQFQRTLLLNIQNMNY